MTDQSEAAQDNLREAWSALAMIREAVETLGPIGSMRSSEHLDGPTFTHEADEIVKGIFALTHDADEYQTYRSKNIGPQFELGEPRDADLSGLVDGKTNSEIAERMEQTFAVTGDVWFKRAATALYASPPPVAIFPIVYDYDAKGNIVLPASPPFDGHPVLIKLASGWYEAWWDNGRKYETQDGTEYEGFNWVCMNADFTAELDAAKFWMALPQIPPPVTDAAGDVQAPLVRDMIKAAMDCVSDYPIASGRIVSQDGTDGYGSIRALRIALEALQRSSTGTVEASK